MDEQRPDHLTLRTYLADHDAACPGCGYNLRGLTGSICPECQRSLAIGVVGARVLSERGARLVRFGFVATLVMPVLSLLGTGAGLRMLWGRAVPGMMVWPVLVKYSVAMAFGGLIVVTWLVLARRCRNEAARRGPDAGTVARIQGLAIMALALGAQALVSWVMWWLF